ncbi:MAG: DUF2628 domain-containing protein [Clostridia bacterium]|nr:DUF2628 domain-containing protein [Clostridia bacterium]
MNYTGIKCPACGFIFKEGDDIVVCPDCGTPHHRDCWKANNGCFNMAKHDGAFKFEFTPPEVIPELREEDAEGVFCPRCGFKNQIGTVFCSKCGERLSPDDDGEPDTEEEMSFGGFLRTSDGRYKTGSGNRYSPYQNPYVREAESRWGGRSVDGIPVGEVAEFVQKKSGYYIGKFLSMQDNETKISWNFSSFFFPFFWAFYRKMVGIGVAVMLLMFSAGMFSGSMIPWIFEKTSPAVFEEYENAYESMFDSYATLSQSGGSEGMNEFYEAFNTFAASPVLKASLVTGAALQLIICVCMGFFGNYLYKRRVLRNINLLRERCGDANTYHMLMRGAGGVSVWSVVLPVIVYFFAMMMSGMF